VKLLATAAVVITGHGFGHGIGMQQYGAFGYASQEGRSAGWILRHYFPGTHQSRRPGLRVRVLLERRTQPSVRSASHAVDARGRRVTLRTDRSYRAEPWRTNGIALRNRRTGHIKARLHAPVRITGGRSTVLRGVALNDRRGHAYRGRLVLSRLRHRIAVVDDLRMESYLYGVVPAEMPASWPQAALRAQAIAARTYALRSLRPDDALYDVLPNTSNQVYAGVDEETAATTRAVQRTDPRVLTYHGAVAETLFSSSSGGTTEAVQDAFPGAAPVPYLVSVNDPWDRLSPFHDWTASFTKDELEQRLQPVLDGHFVSLQVTARTPTGRAAAVRVTGTTGAQDVPAAMIRSLLGLRSSWFDVSAPPSG
jgi:stage II sporulation protein D